MLSQSASVRNRLLTSLPSDVLGQLMPKLTQIDLGMRQPLYNPGSVIEAVYFPEAGMISLVSNLEEGMQAEVGIIGLEGMLGTSLLSGEDSSFIEAMVQMPGTALRMGKIEFRHELETNAPFRALMLRYNEALQTQVMQTAACNSRHQLEQRLARWLLMAHDRADRTELPLTQEFMAMMLGVARPSITMTAGILQRAGMIRNSGGRVTILDRSSLEAGSCECYEVVKRRLAVLLGTPAS